MNHSKIFWPITQWAFYDIWYVFGKYYRQLSFENISVNYSKIYWPIAWKSFILKWIPKIQLQILPCPLAFIRDFTYSDIVALTGSKFWRLEHWSYSMGRQEKQRRIKISSTGLIYYYMQSISLIFWCHRCLGFWV